MKILITDIENNIGTYLYKNLSNNHIVLGFTKDELYLPDKNSALETIINTKPDILIHTSSVENLELCEENESIAYTYNTIGSLNAAYPCSLLDIPIIYISTSYVYDGEKSTPYYETDDCSPINVYGKTKLASEKLIRTLCKKFFILRTSWIYGGEDCFVKNVLNNKLAEVIMCTQEIGNPTHIKDLAITIEKLLHSDLYGIYNCSSISSVSKQDWVSFIFEELNIERTIIPISDSMLKEGAPRPKNGSLNTSLLKNCFDITIPNWSSTLKEYLNLLK